MIRRVSTSGSGDPGRLIVVCTANVCRAPLAAAILAERLLPRDLAQEVVSAGVRGLDAAPMCPVSAGDLADAEWLVAVGHRSRRLTAEHVAEADLVLTMEREHRAAAVRLLPGSQARVFTLREAEALLAAVRERGSGPVEGLEPLARAMHAARGSIAPPPPVAIPRPWWRRPSDQAEPLDLVDGHGAAEAEHRRAVAAVRRAAAGVADSIVALSG